MKVDIGEIIKQEFEKSGLSASQFARMINKERSLVYHLFKRQSIDTDLLYRISMALNIDLFKMFSENLKLENRVIEACDFKKTDYSSSKRRVMLEVELDDSEFMQILTKALNNK